ncbi:hypothetical protein BWZ31_12705, partial [Neisseria meningitidis]
ELQAWKYGAVSPTLRQASGLRADDDRLVTQIWSGDSSQLIDYERSVVELQAWKYGAVSPTLRQASGLRADDDRLVTQIWS